MLVNLPFPVAKSSIASCAVSVVAVSPYLRHEPGARGNVSAAVDPWKTCCFVAVRYTQLL